MRYLTQDDAIQSAKVTEIFERRLTQKLQVEVLVIENEQQVFTSMVALKQGRASFADALIAELGARAGCKFDRHRGGEMSCRWKQAISPTSANFALKSAAPVEGK